MYGVLAAMALLLSVTVVSCVQSEGLRDEGSLAQQATVVPPVEVSPTPPPIPQSPPWAYIEYGGYLYQGIRGRSCRTYGTSNRQCAERAPWEEFDGSPSLAVKRGDEFTVVVISDDYITESGEVDRGEVSAQVLAVVETVPYLVAGDEVYATPIQTYAVVKTVPVRQRWGFEVYTTPVDEGVTLNLPPDVYLLILQYRSSVWEELNYEFKLEVVD